MSKPQPRKESPVDRKSANDGSNSSGRPDAGNDPVFRIPASIPTGLETRGQIEEAFGRMSDAPEDVPHVDDAVKGLSIALQELEDERPGVSGIRVSIDSLVSGLPTGLLSIETNLALSRRKGRYLIYALLREIGRKTDNVPELDPQVLRLIATWCCRMLIDGHQPSPKALAQARAALLYPEDTMAKKWTAKARSRALISARSGLDAAIEGHPTASAAFGLSAQRLRAIHSNTPIEKFNQAYRRRVENLNEYHTLDAVAGAGGHDTLTACALQTNGKELLDMARTGDMVSLVVCLEIITHLPSAVVLQVPVTVDGIPPQGALAWFDTSKGTYCQTLYKLKERGAYAPAGKEDLYESTTYVVAVLLSPPIHKLLQDLASEHDGTPIILGDLTGQASHYPRSRVVGQGGYKVTSRRMQESLPALLLQNGHHRWPVAMATTSHFLVSVGRRGYGVCRSSEVDAVVRASHRLLGWPVREDSTEVTLIGAPTTPRSSSITKCLNELAERANSHTVQWHSTDSIVEGLNNHARWISMLLALCLALRSWIAYQLKVDEMNSGDVMTFVDKDVHLFDGPGVPVVSLLRTVLNGWFNLCLQSVDALTEIATPESQRLACDIKQRVDGSTVYGAVFTIDQVGRTQTIGHKSWQDSLPENLRLRANFARHFWPLQLMDLRVAQTVIDLLMRHQIEGLHAGSSSSARTIKSMQSKLREAMDQVIEGLGLRIPFALDGGNDE